MTESRVIPGGTPKWLLDATANDSDKTFTVPAGKVWVMESIFAQLVATATVGNRVLMIQFGDGTNVVRTMRGSNNIAASQTGTYQTLRGTEPTNTTVGRTLAGANANVSHADPMGMELVLPEGHTVRVWDFAAIDPNADDLTVVLHYVEYEA